MQLTWLPNPLTAQGKQAHQAIALEGETLHAYCARMGLRVAGPIAADVNGVAVADWRSHVLQQGDVIVLRRAVAGGGGGDSNPLQIVLMVAVMAVSMGVGGLSTAAGSGLFGVGSAASQASLALMIGGSLLVNALTPPPKAKQNEKAQFSLQEFSNRARLFEPLPYVIGTRRMAFDLASKPYTRFEDGEQYLYQTFCVGLQPDCRVTGLKIGETAIEKFSGVEVFWSDAQGQLPAMFSDVDVAEGAQVKDYEAPMVRTSALNTRRLELDLVAMGFLTNTKKGSTTGEEVRARLEYRALPSGSWNVLASTAPIVPVDPNASQGVLSVAGAHLPMPVSVPNEAPGISAGLKLTVSGDFQGSYSLWRGIYSESHRPDLVAVVPAGQSSNSFTQGGVFQIAGIPDRSLVVRCDGLWDGAINLSLETDKPAEPVMPEWFVTPEGQQPVRATVGIDVAPGQYEVRVTKLSRDYQDTDHINNLHVTALKSYQATSSVCLPAIRRIGVRIRASAQLQGGLQDFTGTVEGLTWQRVGSGWVRGYNDNPASWFREFATGKFGPDGNRLYGAGLLPAQIDDDSLASWYDFCEANSLKIGLQLSSARTVGDVLNAIARCGRASPTWQTGKLGVTVERAGLLPVAVFGPANIIAGSMKIAWHAGDLADEVVATFSNKAKNYTADQVRVRAPGVISPKQTVTVDLDGVCDPAQAGKAANLLLANNLYHRREISWETDIEGMICQRGDVVRLSHDLTTWGHSGRLLDVNGTALTLDRALPDSVQGWVGLRSPDGTYATTRGNVVGGVLTLEVWPVGLPPFDGDPLEWLWFYDLNGTPGKLVRITDVEPLDEYTVRFKARDESAAYFAAEGGTFFIYDGWTGVQPLHSASDLNLSWQLTDPDTGRCRAQLRWLTTAQAPVEVRVWRNDVQVIHQRTSALSIEGDIYLGDTITARVEPQPGPGIRVGASAERSWDISNFPEYDSTFPKPASAVVYASPDADGYVNALRVVLDYPDSFLFPPDGLCICVAVTPYPNKLTLDQSGTGNVLDLGAEAPIAGGRVPILAGSTRSKIVLRESFDPFPPDLNVVGQFWLNIPGSPWRKVVRRDDTAAYLDAPFASDPQPGSLVDWAETAWADLRPAGNSRLLALVGDKGLEIVQWEEVQQIQIGVAGYRIKVQRGQEGTAVIDQSNVDAYYYPAPGSGTQQILIPAGNFKVTGNVYSGDAEIALRVPPGWWCSITCYPYRQTEFGLMRGPIVPMTYGGAL